MNSIRTARGPRRAFTLIELIAVIVVLAILSGVALPKFFDYSAKAKESACRGVLGGVRSAIANFYSNSAVSGTAAYPTIAELRTIGTVMQEVIPENPFNGDDRIRAATWDVTNPPVSGPRGWCYDAAAGKFWPNSNTVGENLW